MRAGSQAKWMSVVVGLLGALLSFGFIVFIHELGHFLAARWAGIRCPYFAIGFGPRLLAFHHGGTEFSIRLFPLGGYVLMVGEDPGVDSGDSWHNLFVSSVGDVQFPTTPAKVLEGMPGPEPQVEEFLRALPPQRVYHTMGDLEGNFNAKSTFQRTVVILGGVFNNFVCAILLFLLLGFTKGLGVPVPINLPRAGEVFPNTPAARAGLQKDDTLLALDGQPVVSGEDFRELVRRRAGEEVQLKVRDTSGKEREMSLVPDLSVGTGHYFQTVQGKVQLIRVDKGVPVPGGITLPFTITAANDKTVANLRDLSKVASGTRKLTLTGPAGTWAIALPEGETFDPRGLTGIALVQATSFAFENKATNEVVAVTPGSLADKIGIQKGDELVELQGRSVWAGQTQLENALQWLKDRHLEGGRRLRLSVLRGKEFKELQLAQAPPGSVAEFGIQLRPVDAQVVLSSTAERMGQIVSIPVVIARSMMANLFGTVRELRRSSAGPLGIMQQAYEVSQVGLGELLLLIAILNAFIATFNLLPIPALDGSRILFIWVGALRGRALDPDKEARVHFLGIVILLSLVVLVSIQDFQRMWAGTPLIK